MNEEEIITRFSEQKGHVGFYCENLITGESFGYHSSSSPVLTDAEAKKEVNDD